MPAPDEQIEESKVPVVQVKLDSQGNEIEL